MCNRITRTKEIRVQIEPNASVFWGCRTEKERERELNDWARGIGEFFRDHRSMDVNTVEVVKEDEDVCSACGYQWESMYDDGLEACAYCGEYVGDAVLAQVAELHEQF